MSSSGLARIEWKDALGRSYGTATAYCAAVEDSGHRGSGYWPNYTYVCPRCGQAWAHEIWTHSFHYQNLAGPEWKVRSEPCRWHGGGFLLDHLPLETCSPEIIHRELTLYFNSYDKEHANECADYPSYSTLAYPYGRREPNPSRPQDPARGPNGDREDNLTGHGR